MCDYARVINFRIIIIIIIIIIIMNFFLRWAILVIHYTRCSHFFDRMLI